MYSRKENNLLKSFIIMILILLCLVSITPAQTQENLEVEQIFKGVEDWIFKKGIPESTKNSEIHILFKPQPIRWQGGKTYHADLEIYCESQSTLETRYKGRLNNLFDNYLKKNGWKLKFISKDHYGEYAYRILQEASNENVRFYYIFTATRKGGWGSIDWDGHIYILTEREVEEEKETQEDLITNDAWCKPFFNQVLNWVKNPRKNAVFDTRYFNVNIFEQPVKKKSQKQTINYQLSFSCEYGPNSTKRGELCYELMPKVFFDFLESKGYKTTKIKDESQTGWIKKLYKAKKQNHSFTFLFESENSISGGYAQVRIMPLNF